MKCNACWRDLEGKAVSTTCGHLLCTEDAGRILSNDAACPVCDQVLSKSLMRPVDVSPNDEWINMAMAGITPQLLMKSAYRSVMFYAGQKELEMHFKMNRIVAQCRQKCEAMQEKFTEKLEQEYSAYQKMAKKCQMMEQEMESLSKDKQELQEKISEKSRQKRKLDEMYDQLRCEYESIKRTACQPANSFYSGTEPDLFSKGDVASVSHLIKGVNLFSDISGLSPNRSKSCCFFGNTEVQDCILTTAGFARGSLPICDQVLSKSLMRPVVVSSNDDCINMAMAGITPQILMKSAYRSVMFYAGQKELEMHFKMNRIVAHCRQKCEAMQEKFTEKLEQVHSAYQKMAKTCQMMEQEMESLSKDKQELQEKISEKSRQKRKLDEKFTEKLEQVHSAYQKMAKKCQMMEKEMESLSKDKQELQEKFSEKSRQKRKLEEKFTEKLEQVHSAYQKMAKKCQMMEQEMESLSKDKQELQEKFSEKSRQKRKLDEMYDQLRCEYVSVKRTACQPVNNFYSGTEPDLFANTANMMPNRDPFKKDWLAYTLDTPGPREDIWPSAARQNSSNSGPFDVSAGAPVKQSAGPTDFSSRTGINRTAFGAGARSGAGSGAGNPSTTLRNLIISPIKRPQPSRRFQMWL